MMVPDAEQFQDKVVVKSKPSIGKDLAINIKSDVRLGLVSIATAFR